MSNDLGLTLADLGELRLIDEVLLPLALEYDSNTEVGNDCSYIPLDGRLLAVTADVGPRPLLHKLPGYEHDLTAAGWLSVVSTASDVATAGARPLFVTNCVDAPPNLRVADFARFMRGYFEASAAFGFRNGGGDVRHGPALAIRVFGCGVVGHGDRIGRAGARPGDHIVLVGAAGNFMATYLLAAERDPSVVREGKLLPGAEAVLRFPRPQLKEMMCLAAQRVVVAASDTSDGLLGAVDNLARNSGCGFEFHLRDAILPDVVVAAASARGIDPWNIFFAWGDWAVAVVVRPEHFSAFQRICTDQHIQWLPLGQATAQPRRITARINDGPLRTVVALRNENFVSVGYNAGIDKHLEYMLSTNLFSSFDSA